MAKIYANSQGIQTVIKIDTTEKGFVIYAFAELTQ